MPAVPLLEKDSRLFWGLNQTGQRHDDQRAAGGERRRQAVAALELPLASCYLCRTAEGRAGAKDWKRPVGRGRLTTRLPRQAIWLCST